MAFSSSITTKGGDKLKAVLAKAEKNAGKRTRVQGRIPSRASGCGRKHDGEHGGDTGIWRS